MSARPPRVLIVGSSFHFTSGISYYTCRAANSLADEAQTSVLLMRRLVPRFLYPGRKRIGQRVHGIDYDARVSVLDGVDWYWGRSMVAARRFLRTQRPDVVVFQWWTGAVLHSYLALASYARSLGAQVIIEWHEVQDTGEARIPGVTRYVRSVIRRLLRSSHGHIIHSEYDRALLSAAYDLRGAPQLIVPHGPYDHHEAPAGQAAQPASAARSTTTNILYFGVIRPYKGVENLVAAFESLPDDEAASLRLTIVGETWEGWQHAVDAALTSPRAAQITVVNRYVTDAELTEHVAAADIVALPYKRSSSSGPLHVAMSAGLPVVVTDVGGLREAVGSYAGAVVVEPDDVAALAAGILAARELVGGAPYTDSKSWKATVAGYLYWTDADEFEDVHRALATVAGERA